MQCQAITNLGKQCSKKALPNSNFCWQHQNYILKTESTEVKLSNNNLLLNALQPGIIGNIIQLSGQLQPFSKKLSNHLNKRAILGTWFTQIGVQTLISQIKDYEIPLLWNIYQKRIDNYPSRELIEIATKKGLDKYIFHSKDYPYTIYGKDYVYGHNLSNDDLHDVNIINRILKDKIKEYGMRKGDILTLTYKDDYYIVNGFVYDGEKLVKFTFFPNQYGNLPKDIHINDFPTTDYFKYSLTNDTFVPFNTTDQKIIDKVEYSYRDINPNFENLEFYLYKTNKDYYVWSINNELEKEWYGILCLDYNNRFVLDDTTGGISQETIDKTPEIISGIKSYKMLYDPEYYTAFR
jgi:hypothetical protein